MRNLFTHLFSFSEQSWGEKDQVGTKLRGGSAERVRMLDGAYIQHTFSIYSSYIGTSRRSAGNKAKTPFGILRLAAMITLLLTLACGNVWGGTKRIYLDTNGKGWTAASATIWVHAWDGGGNWDYKMSQWAGDIYYADINDAYTNCQFVRNNSSATAISWSGDGFWGKTGSLTIGTNNRYVLSDYSNQYSNGSWNQMMAVKGGTIYFDNSLMGWSSGNIQFFHGDDTHNYTFVDNMSNISNTKLWYKNLSAGNSAASYVRFANDSYSSGSFGSGNNPSKRTATYTGTYEFNSSSLYLFTTSSGSNGASISPSYKSDYNALNCTITVAAKVKAVGESYTAGTSKGKLDASAKKFTSYNSCGTGTSTSVAVGSTSSTIIAGYTCTKCTLTVSSVADGYTFMGWYDSNGTKLSDNTTYTGYLPKSTTTVYAYFDENSYTITYNNMTGATNHASNPSSYSVTSSTITLQTPTKSGYGFGGWYSDASCTTRVWTIPTGSTGNKTLYAKWLTPHEPGYYVTNSPGYNVALTTYSSLKYELYRYGVSSPNYYVCAGETPTTSSASYNFLNGNKTGSSYHWDANSWLGHTNVYGVTSGSISEKNEFPAKTAGTLSCRNQQGVVMCIKGYKQFSYWGQDNDDNGSNEKQFKVYFNGVDSTKSRSKTSGGTIRRYTLDSTQTYVIEILGNTENNNLLYGFSMRPGRPRITSSSLSGATYDVGDVARHCL